MSATHRIAGSAVWLLAGLAALAVAAALMLGSTRGPMGWNAPARVQAQEVRVPEGAGITVVGDGVARTQPDTTTIRLGVQVTAKTPAEALGQVRQATERLLQQLRSRGVAETDIQTGELNVFPIQAPGRDGPPDPTAISGYRGAATVIVQGQDVNRAGALLDAAVQAGATSVQGLSFGMRDDSQLRRQALTAAIQDARPKAEAAAAAAGLTITGVRSIVEQPLGPPKGGGGMGGGAEGVAPGELSVAVRAQVTFDVSR